MAWAGSPFGAYTGDVYRTVRPAGMSVAEIVASVPGLPDSFAAHGSVCVNAEPVPRDMWPYVRPRNGQVPVAVTLHMPLRGGGDRREGKSTFALVASVALLAATTAISAGALGPAGFAAAGGYFAAGSTSAQLLAGAVGLGGALAIAALSPPPAVASGDNDREAGSAGASGNILQPGEPLPRTAGTFRAFPAFATFPLIDIVDDDEVAEAVFAFAGPHAFADIRLGSGDADDADDIEIEEREGWDDDTDLTLITRQGRTIAPSLELRAHQTKPGTDSLLDQADPAGQLPIWHTFTTRDSPDEIWLHLLFPQGIYDMGASGEETVPVRVRIRKLGDVSWIHLPEVHFSWNEAKSLKKAIKIVWATAPTATEPEDSGAPTAAFMETEDQTVSPSSSKWTAHSHFDDGSGTKYMSSASYQSIDTRVANTILDYESATFYLDEVTFPKGIYELQIKRGAVFDESSFSKGSYQIGGTVLDFFWYRTDGGTGLHIIDTSPQRKVGGVVALRLASVWNTHPIGKSGMALIAVKGKNRQISDLSVLASGYVPDWDGEVAWSNWITTTNPAPHINYALTGSLNAKALSTSLIDNDSLVAFRTHCIDNAHEVNVVFDGGRALDHPLTVMAAAGFGRPYKSEVWGVIIDDDRSADSPVQIFSPRNMRDFRWEKAFADIPHAFIVKFKNADKDYQDDEVIVYRDGFTAGNATLFESISYVGLATEAEVSARAAFDLEQAVERSTFYYGTAPAEALVARRGDLVGVQHDIIDIQAGFARVKAKATSGGNVTGLTLDSVIPVKAGADFFADDDVFDTADIFANSAQTGVTIRLKDGSIITHEISGDVEETDEVTFVTPFADPGADLSLDCLVVAGALASEFSRMILHGALPGSDLTVQLTFVDEAPALHS